MRHRVKGRKLSRKRASRDHLLRNLATQVILYERIETTLAKAREVRPLVEKMIAIGKLENKVLAIRRLKQISFDKNAVNKIISDLSKEFKGKESGITRVIRLGQRPGDGAEKVVLELLLSESRKKKDIKAKIKVRTRKARKTGAREGGDKKGLWQRIKSVGSGKTFKENAGIKTKITKRTTSK